MRWDEEVAKKEKVCPMTMTLIDGVRLRSHNCIGSKCMAWRGSSAETTTLHVDLEGDEVEESTVAKKGSGYCGMAGQPE